jgi:hypothetical protein
MARRVALSTIAKLDAVFHWAPFEKLVLGSRSVRGTPNLGNPQAANSLYIAIRCKGCAETIPAPVGNMPDTWIIAVCPLCGEQQRYLPGDIFRGKLSQRFTAAPKS